MSSRRSRGNNKKSPSTTKSGERNIQHEILETLPEEKRELILAQMSYSGPIPHPSIIKEYEQVLPGAAERILASFEKQSNHRQDIERKIVQGSITNERMGQVFALVIALTLIGSGLYLTLDGHGTVGGIIFSTTVAAGASVFIIGRRYAKEGQSENTEK